MIGGLLAGALIGLVVAGIGLICFTDLTFPDNMESRIPPDDEPDIHTCRWEDTN